MNLACYAGLYNTFNASNFLRFFKVDKVTLHDINRKLFVKTYLQFLVAAFYVGEDNGCLGGDGDKFLFREWDNLPLGGEAPLGDEDRERPGFRAVTYHLL